MTQRFNKQTKVLISCAKKKKKWTNNKIKIKIKLMRVCRMVSVSEITIKDWSV